MNTSAYARSAITGTPFYLWLAGSSGPSLDSRHKHSPTKSRERDVFDMQEERTRIQGQLAPEAVLDRIRSTRPSSPRRVGWRMDDWPHPELDAAEVLRALDRAMRELQAKVIIYANPSEIHLSEPIWSAQVLLDNLCAGRTREDLLRRDVG